MCKCFEHAVNRKAMINFIQHIARENENISVQRYFDTGARKKYDTGSS
jgi:hypothetical protein